MRLVIVCLGGAVGAGLRYLVSGWVSRGLPASFPAGTLVVNVTGAFLLAFLMQVSLLTDAVPPAWRLALGTGVLGGFTTYSTFNYETTVLLREGAHLLAAANVVATLFGALLAGWLGLVLGQKLAGG